MGSSNLPEVVEHEVEVLPAIELNQAKLDAMIQFSQQTEKFGKALDNIRRFVMSRALPGDWVQFEDKISPTGPATDRMLSALGLMGVPITFADWNYNKSTGADKHGDWYEWVYWADVTIGGLRLGRIEGIAGSRTKFFGYEHGAFKDLADVREADVRMAARRAVLKEAIRVALGLRGIPADQAEALGLDPKKIKKVTFEKRGAATGEKITVTTKIKNVGQRKLKTDKVVYVIELESGQKPETFSESLAKIAKGFANVQTSVKIVMTPTNYAPKLESIEAAGEAAGDAQDAADAEPRE